MMMPASFPSGWDGGHAEFLGAHFVEDVAGIFVSGETRGRASPRASDVRRGGVFCRGGRRDEARRNRRDWKSRRSRSETARASPTAIATVVLAVGARLREQASSLTLTSRTTSLASASVDFRIAGERDEGDFEALEGFEEIDDFLGFAAVGDGEERVAAGEHAEIAVEGFGGMKKKGWRAGAGEGGGDFAADEAGLAHAGDDDAAFAGEEEIDGVDEGGVEAREDILDGLGFDAENAAGGVEAHALLQRRTRVESSLRRARSCGSCASGRALGPSERAAAGLS